MRWIPHIILGSLWLMMCIYISARLITKAILYTKRKMKERGYGPQEEVQ